MSLTKEQLQELFDTIRDRLLEFELPMPSTVLLTKGAVRIAYEVISAHLRGQLSPVREEAADKRHFAELGPKGLPKAVESAQNGVSGVVAAILGPEPEFDTPHPRTRIVPKRGSPLAPKDVNPASNAISSTAAATLGPDLEGLTDSELKPMHLREIIAELQMLSKHGEMPTMAEWDERRPLHLSKAQAVLARHRLTWGRLAEYARLKYEGRRSLSAIEEPA